MQRNTEVLAYCAGMRSLSLNEITDIYGALKVSSR